METTREDWIREMWALLGPDAATLGTAVHDRWIASDAELLTRFAGVDLKAHVEHVTHGLAAIVATIDEPAAVVHQIVLTAREGCVAYLSDRQYEGFAQALIEELAARLGPAFVPAARSAWAEELRVLAALVRRVTRRVGHRPAPIPAR